MSTVNKALAALLRDSAEWREFFRQCCESGALRLRAQATTQFREELADRGHAFSAAEVEDAMLTAARKLLPNTPATQWDAEHAERLCRDAMARMGECFAKLSEDEAAFREALEGWERAGLEALVDLWQEGAA